MERKITGTMYSYYFLCKRKLWLFNKGISLEHENENVQIGKIIDETSYIKERKHILLDDSINIDYIKDGIVYEIKKSNKEKQMAVNQIKYYLYILNKNNFENTKGILNIPKERVTEEVILTQEDAVNIEDNLQQIKKILNQEKAPQTINKPACKSCAYFEFCYI